MRLLTSSGRLCLAILVFAAGPVGAAVVYKWTDANGVVHYSDQPVEGAERIVTAGGSSNGIGGTTRAPSRPPPAAGRPAAAVALSIESPQKEQVFFGDEVVAVRLHAEPGLAPGQQVKWTLNGSALTDQGSSALNFALPPMPRGSYTLSATVVDSGSGESQAADSVTFYVRQPSALAPLDPLRKK
jgi:hypothetical protein